MDFQENTKSQITVEVPSLFPNKNEKGFIELTQYSDSESDTEDNDLVSETIQHAAPIAATKWDHKRAAIETDHAEENNHISKLVSNEDKLGSSNIGTGSLDSGVPLEVDTQSKSTDLLSQGLMVSPAMAEITDSDSDSEGLTLVEESEPKPGSKRTAAQRDHEEINIPVVATDSVYIMSIVEEELKAVQKTLVTKPSNENVDGSEEESGVCSDSSSESSDSESSESESSSDESSSSQSQLRKIIENAVEIDEEKVPMGSPHTKDELLIKDLPLEPEVDIQLDKDANMVHIGNIAHAVGTMVVVQALPHTPALDIDTLLFLESRTCIGRVFETFGPVQSPYYSMRFNSEQDIADKGVVQGLDVFFVPGDEECTKLVFTAQLKKLKGSDASWKHDQEPPQELVEFSDDEQEAQVKSKKKKERKNQKASKESGTADGTPTVHHCKQQQQDGVSQHRPWQGRGRGLSNAPRGPPPRGPSWQGQGMPQGGPPHLPPFHGRFPVGGPRHYMPPPGPYPMGPEQPHSIMPQGGPGCPPPQGPFSCGPNMPPGPPLWHGPNMEGPQMRPPMRGPRPLPPNAHFGHLQGPYVQGPNFGGPGIRPLMNLPNDNVPQGPPGYPFGYGPPSNF